MSRLLFFHDFASPYCRLALDAVSEAGERTELEVRPVPYELRPAPDPLPALDAPALVEELETAGSLADLWGIPLHAPPRIPRTRKAHEAVAFALDRSDPARVMALMRGIYDAVWERGLDIARLDVLLDIGDAAGLDREALHVALGMDTFEPDVVREEHAALGAEIPGVPAVQLGSVLASGLIPVDELVEWIVENS